MAAQDLTGWKTLLACALPAGDGAVALNAANRQVTVTVQWNDSRGTSGNTAQTFQIQTQL